MSTESNKRIRVAITLGDPNGIGPEVILKCLDDPLVQGRTEPIVVGPPEVLRIHAKKLGRRLPPLVENLEGNIPKRAIRIADTSQEAQTVVEMGKLTPRGGNMAMFAVDEGLRLVQEGTASALVTGPISKLAIVRAGYNFPGHTEYLAKKLKAKEHVMMMVAKSLRISLATGHIPLKQVSERVTVNGLIAKLKRVKATLVQDFGIIHPRIAILGLNPHAGEDGVLGTEETEVIIEAIKGAGRRSIVALGPFPADGFFGSRQYCGYDGIMAMYHDQGLIPFKTLSFGSGVNFTAGLPIVRTSPDHGTAFGIAGQDRADPGSMIQAVLLAASVVEQRKQQN